MSFEPRGTERWVSFDSKRDKYAYHLYQMTVLYIMLEDSILASEYFGALLEMEPYYPYADTLASWIDEISYQRNPYSRNPSEEERKLHKWMVQNFTQAEVDTVLKENERAAFADFKDKLTSLMQAGYVVGAGGRKYYSLSPGQIDFIKGLCRKLYDARKAPMVVTARFGPSKLDAKCKVCNNKYLKGATVHIGTWTHQHCFESLKINVPEQFISGSPSFIPPSPHQEAIKQQYLTSNSHIIIDAKAGSGKTTTLEWLVTTTYDKTKHVVMVAFNRSIRTELKERVRRANLINVEAYTLNSYGFSALRKLHPIPENEKWDVKEKKMKILIEREGFGPKGLGFPTNIEEIKTRFKLTDPEAIQKLKKRNQIIRDALKELSDKVRQNLATPDQYPSLVEKYQINLEGLTPEDVKLVYDLLPELLDLGVIAVEKENLIDYIDQNWIPTAKQYQLRTKQAVVLPKTLERMRVPERFYVDTMFVDETQDLNRCQAEFALMCVGDRGRLILTGDPFQSIYSFAGADSQSMKRLEQLLTPTPRGCVKLPLAVSWRCPVSVIQLARGILAQVIEPGQSNIEARPDAGQGQILEMKPKAALESLSLADAGLTANGKVPVMFLCRANAPLFGFAFQVLGRGIPVRIQGRDICKNILDYLDDINPKKKKVENEDLAVLHRAIGIRRKEIEKLEKASDQNFDLELDKLSVIEMFATKPEATGVEWIRNQLDEMFTAGYCPECEKKPLEKRFKANVDDEHCPICIEDTDKGPGKYVPIIKRQGIIFSTIHKAKGLEALRVYLLEPGRLGKARKKATEEDIRQEIHIYYVAVTRTMYDKKFPADSGLLVYISEEETERQEERRDFHPEELPSEEEEDFEEGDHEGEAEDLDVPMDRGLLKNVEPKETILLPVKSLEEMRSIKLPSLPSTGAGLFSEPTIQDCRELRDAYIARGIPAKLVQLPGWFQYALVVNAIACASTTINIGSEGSRKKGVKAIRVVESDPASGRFMNREGATIKRTGGWKGRILERLNTILVRRQATPAEIGTFNKMRDIVGFQKRSRRRNLRRHY